MGTSRQWAEGLLRHTVNPSLAFLLSAYYMAGTDTTWQCFLSLGSNCHFFQEAFPDYHLAALQAFTHPYVFTCNHPH